MATADEIKYLGQAGTEEIVGQVKALSNDVDTRFRELGAVSYNSQLLTAEQQDQARKNIGIAENIIIRPTIGEFVRDNNGAIVASANYLRTDHLLFDNFKRIEYDVFVTAMTKAATWAVFDADKKWLGASGDVNGNEYNTILTDNTTATYGHMRKTIIVDDILERYPTAVYIVFSTSIHTEYKSFYNKDSVNVGWGVTPAYVKMIVDENYGSVIYNNEQDLTLGQRECAQHNIGVFGNRKYVEEFKTALNDWDNAFADLIQYCTENHYVACAAGTYELTNPLIIGDVDVDFEHSDITNNKTTEACIILTGANHKIHRFGSITAREGIGILVNGDDTTYTYNKLYAKLVRGYASALTIEPTNNSCWINEYHILRLRSSRIPLRICSRDNSTVLANESYFYLGSLEEYRDIKPIKLVELTNVSRCNFYNLDIEQEIADPVNGSAVELTNCIASAFFNPRIQEPYNSVQFRFIGISFYNLVDCEYCKYATIDSSQLQMSDIHFNVIRGNVVTNNNGSSTNCNTLRVYKDMVIPVMLAPMVAEVRTDIEINSNTVMSSHATGSISAFGIPTLYRWKSGNITINRRFIALLIPKLQIMKISESVGNILDEEGNLIISGSDLVLNNRYDINASSFGYELVSSDDQVYRYLTDIVLSIDLSSGQNGSEGATIPTITTADNGKFLRVVNGVWAAVSIPSAEEVTF